MDHTVAYLWIMPCRYGSSPLLLLLFVPLSLGWFVLQRYYRASARELQRLNSISKSPIYSAFNEALNGSATIQAFGETERFCALQRRRFDYNLRAAYLTQATAIWLQVRPLLSVTDRYWPLLAVIGRYYWPLLVAVTVRSGCRCGCRR